MKTDSGLHRLVYEYYEARIQYGFYSYRERLPSIPQICGIFQMAPATVRSALALLEKEGYIQVDARRAAQVIYQASPSRFRENAAKYFVPREAGILDLAQSGLLLFEPLWEEGLRRWGEKEWKMLRDGIQKPSQGAVSMPVLFYLLALGTFRNRLLLNLYWETIRYIRFPYLADEEKEKAAGLILKEGSKDEIISMLREKFELSYGEAAGSLFRFIRKARSEFSLETEKPVPFRWNIYRRRPQLRDNLAARIVREIIDGKYSLIGYLPSLPKMAEQYGVAVNTVRRTMNVLEGLGLVEARQGKGYRICGGTLRIDFSKTEIKEGLRLYQEALQLSALTIRPVILHTLEHSGEKEREKLTQDFIRLREDGKSYLGFDVVLAYIEEHCPLALVRECYGRIRELLCWGYPFVRIRFRQSDLHEAYREKMAQAEHHLKAWEAAAFADDWKLLMEQEERQIQPLMDGLKEEKRDRTANPSAGFHWPD
ncbi:GntR family transcriptional regulator [Cuneatibacter sp. NSJ-177]|uniref:GntR family transcriptional regulator n=1 Tax=Cuneatibacter sp. NSJ-177 TaxID=2931401 RepID=UPI001FD608A4|nr:GntR family transcriptional regulator [Cuneatibacter sp. NSJ-177]MCJ7835172.1 GntR family transcriptional regulator [Cuneatibacter sp. NSJ-177]